VVSGSLTVSRPIRDMRPMQCFDMPRDLDYATDQVHRKPQQAYHGAKIAPWLFLV
jgi:hypothetical protein